MTVSYQIILAIRYALSLPVALTPAAPDANMDWLQSKCVCPMQATLHPFAPRSKMFDLVTGSRLLATSCSSSMIMTQSK